MITGNEMQNLGKDIMAQVIKELKKSASDGGSVNQACKDAIAKKGVFKFVYNKGNPPDLYHRRYDGGGLADEDNLFTTTIASGDTVTIDIEDRTPENGDGVVDADPLFYLSDLIESGAHGKKWPDSDWPGARPYMEESLRWQCSATGLITIALKAMIKNMNLKV